MGILRVGPGRELYLFVCAVERNVEPREEGMYIWHIREQRKVGGIPNQTYSRYALPSIQRPRRNPDPLSLRS